MTDAALEMALAQTVDVLATPTPLVPREPDPWPESIESSDDVVPEPSPELEDTKHSWEPPVGLRPTRTWIPFAAFGVLAGLALTVMSIVHVAKPSRTTRPTVGTATGERSPASAAMLDPRPSPLVADQQKKAEPPRADPPANSPKASALPAKPVDVAAVPWLDGSGAKAPTCDELLAGASPPSKVVPNAAYEQIQIAHRELVRGDIDASQTALCRASLLDSSNPQAHLDMAQLLLLRRDGTAAVEWAQRSVDLDPKSARAQGLLGDALARVGKPEQARQAWLAEAHISEGDGAALETLAQAELYEAQRASKRRDYRRAERFFRRVVSFKPEQATASAGLAVVLLKLGDSSAANTWARRAVALRENDAKIQMIAGDVCAAIGNRTDAEAHFRRALELDPNRGEASLRHRQLSAANPPAR